MATAKALTKTELPVLPGARLVNGPACGNTGISGGCSGWVILPVGAMGILHERTQMNPRLHYFATILALTPNLDRLAAARHPLHTRFRQCPCLLLRALDHHHRHTLRAAGHRQSPQRLPAAGFDPRVPYLPPRGRLPHLEPIQDRLRHLQRAALGPRILERKVAARGLVESRGRPAVLQRLQLPDCHQSMTMTFPYETYRKRVFDQLAPTNRVADGAFAMPPFLPDTPAYRKQVARIYNGIAKADQDIGPARRRLSKYWSTASRAAPTTPAAPPKSRSTCSTGGSLRMPMNEPLSPEPNNSRKREPNMFETSNHDLEICHRPGPCAAGGNPCGG